MTYETPPFERTVCACAACQSCCDKHPGYMAVGDWERIAAHLNLAPDAAAHLFERGKGAIVGSIERGRGVVHPRRIETIRPRFVDGRCVFLDDNHMCKVHAVAPAGCSFFDMEMSGVEGQRRSVWFLRRIDIDADYHERWKSLPVSK